MMGFVYLIRNKDLYKIGVTQNITQRMKALKPDEVLKILKTKDYAKIEKKLHRKYKDVRIPQTEYFRLDNYQISSCQNELSIPYYRRSKSNPFIIGLISAVLTPTTCIIWGIRHKSFQLGLVPLTAVFIANSVFQPSQNNDLSKFIIKGGGGLIAFTISKRNKKNAIR